MLSFPSQIDKKKFKKQTWVTANQHIFKSGLTNKVFKESSVTPRVVFL